MELLPRLWRVSTAECLHVMTGHTAAVNAVVVTTDGAKTVSGSADGTVKVWSTDTASRCVKCQCLILIASCL